MCSWGPGLVPVTKFSVTRKCMLYFTTYRSFIWREHLNITQKKDLLKKIIIDIKKEKLEYTNIHEPKKVHYIQQPKKKKKLV